MSAPVPQPDHAMSAQADLRARCDALDALLAQRDRELMEAQRRLEAFAYGVSHDLRAPLRTIDGFAQRLGRHADALGDEGRDCLERIRGATTRMGGLIDNLLELARISRAELRPSVVDVSLLAEWGTAELQDLRREQQAQVRVQPGLELVGDERLLKVLVSQLLRNAWQFAQPGAPVQVEVSGERRGARLHLLVRDHGIGFDMAYADKLFQPFQRLHGGEQGAGDGIGLTIAQQVAQRHHGRIHAESAPGEGARFHVELEDLDTETARAA
jgi:light-regulated signal transduction histidine kinase (bacteriophytochrome)